MRCPRLRHGAHISLLSCKAAMQAGLQAARPLAGTLPEPCLRSLFSIAGRVLRRRKEALLHVCTPLGTLVLLLNLPCRLRAKAP